MKKSSQIHTSTRVKSDEMNQYAEQTQQDGYMSRSLNWIIAHMVGKEDFMVGGMDIKINKRNGKSCYRQ